MDVVNQQLVVMQVDVAVAIITTLAGGTLAGGKYPWGRKHLFVEPCIYHRHFADVFSQPARDTYTYILLR